MANQTVYPYGIDGELPSSIGIINDLTTGGVDKALSAEQGIVLRGGSYVKRIGADGLYFCDENGNYTASITADGILRTGVSSEHGANDVVTFSSLSAGEEFRKNLLLDFYWDSDTSTRYTIMRVFKDTVQGGTLVPHVIAVSLSGASPYSALELAINNGYDLVINCGLGRTNGSGEVEGVLIQDGEVRHNAAPQDHIGVMPLTIDSNGGMGYVDTSYNTKGSTLVAQGIQQAFAGFAPLLVDYVPFDGQSAYQSVSHYNQAAQRQIIGQYDNGDYAIITCEGRSYANSVGWTIPQAQAICVKHGLKFAYNCDGGASTQTVVGKKQLNTWYSRKIPVYLYFKY